MKLNKNNDFEVRNMKLLNYIYDVVEESQILRLRDLKEYSNQLFYKKELKTTRHINITINGIMIHLKPLEKIVLFNKEQFEVHVNGYERISFLVMDIDSITIEVKSY